MADRDRHVVLIVIDTARADVFEPYGAQAGSTPALAELARTGWAAPHAVAPSSWTLPSHIGMLLGMPHRQAGLTKPTQARPGLSKPILEANRSSYLPKVLHDNGFRTTGASANAWVQEGSGFADGFDEFTQIWDPGHPWLGKQRLVPVEQALTAALGRSDHGLRKAAKVARRWIDQTKLDRKPSFLFLNVMECHAPYLPPSPFNGIGPLARVQAARDMRFTLDMIGVWRANLAQQLPPPQVLDRMRSLYLGGVRYTDRWIGEFVRELKRAGLYDDTLILVTSDHGENFGECGRLSHAFSVDERLIHVPLIVANAATPEPSPVVSLTDIPRMVAAEVGISVHPWHGGASGNQVAVSRVEGVGTPDDPDVVKFLADYGIENAVEVMTGDTICALDGRFKLVRKASYEDLFDLSADPLEQMPVTIASLDAETTERVTALRAAIDAAERGARDDIAAVAPTAEADPDEVRRLEEQMKLLGYA